MSEEDYDNGYNEGYTDGQSDMETTMERKIEELRDNFVRLLKDMRDAIDNAIDEVYK